DRRVARRRRPARPPPRRGVLRPPLYNDPRSFLRRHIMSELKGKRAAVLVEQQYQEMEVWYPVYRLKEAGCQVTLVGPEAGKTYPSKPGYPAKSDKSAEDVRADDFDVVVIPGGFAPDFIRRTPAMIKFVSDMADKGKLLAAIC